jgi:hypothetical protein
MSELQLDDPDPLPDTREYPVNFETNQAFDGISSRYWLEQEILSRDEREDITQLSNYASDALALHGVGEQTKRHAYVDGAELHRIVLDGAWIYTLIDTLEQRRRCRTWRLGGDGVSWCDDEWRYEEAREVYERLAQLFPLKEQSSNEASGKLAAIRQRRDRAKIALATVILR